METAVHHEQPQILIWFKSFIGYPKYSIRTKLYLLHRSKHEMPHFLYSKYMKSPEKEPKMKFFDFGAFKNAYVITWKIYILHAL